MGPGPSLFRSNAQNLRGWLEEAIESANAALPSSSQAVEETSGPSAEKEIHDHKRKLVTVRRIAAVTTVNSGHIVATIDGWKVVVKKSKGFVEGNLVVFLEIDSFLPAHSKFGHLFAEIGSLTTFNNEEGYRVGTSTWTDRKKNKIISQGHIYHLSDFPDVEKKIRDLRWERRSTHTDAQFTDYVRGVDFTDVLGVKKWESRQDSNSGGTDGYATANPKPPTFILKPDMERVQNCPNLFTKPKYQRFVFQESVKMDGATMTVYFVHRDSRCFAMLPPLPPSTTASPFNNNNTSLLQHAIHPNGRLGVCSRNQDLLPHLLPSSHHHNSPKAAKKSSHHPQLLYWTVALAANLQKTLPALGRTIAIQAELVGATVQGNPHGYPPGAHDMFVFAAFDIDAAARVHPREVERLAARLGLKHVPVLGYRTIPSVARHHQDLIDRAELKKGEGLVFKNCEDGRWFKVLSGRYILEKGDEARARREEEVKKSVEGWEVGEEEVRKIKEVFEDLEEWMRRDDGLRKWMEERRRGYNKTKSAAGQGHGEEGDGKSALKAVEEVEKSATDGVGKADGKMTAVTSEKGTNAGDSKPTGRDYAGATSVSKNGNGFAVPKERRKYLEEWHGINGVRH
ncbi:hypothetical protein VTK56DRAFT_2620 [Thermocarpiscus australiensis]